MYQGQTLSLNKLPAGLVELILDLQGSSVNKLNQLTLSELADAVEILTDDPEIKGLLIHSAKSAFVVGADITEFVDNFRLTEQQLTTWVGNTNRLFSALENLPYPTVVAINGLALGGGFELALAADFRVLADNAKVGFPEVNLGLCPGWGGTVRLSRLIGAADALAWTVSGQPQAAEQALAAGAVDQVVAADELPTEALAFLQQAVNGDVCYTSNAARKLDERAEALDLTQLKQQYRRQLRPGFPAAEMILETISQHVNLPFTAAIKVETDCFVTLAKSAATQSLVRLFLNSTQLKKQAAAWVKQAHPVTQSAVLGAGIMGGGVAYQSASTGTPIIMKDIHDEALTLGINTATELLDKQLDKGRLDAAGKAKVLGAITPTLDYTHFKGVDLVVEAVIENPKVKAAVLAEVEQHVPNHAVLASNTSTISIDLLADSVQRPEQFCGMHFFNPVHQMPLVEVIRGRQTSDATIATTVAYATAMGKTPIVVNDCPGFLVNRILFPYFNGFNRLLKQGVDFRRIDKVMEQFGWPMGPAYLADVIGIDTMVHADAVMQQGFPERMSHDGSVIMALLLADDCLGQKNAKGFYQYGVDESGRRYKEASGSTLELIATQVTSQVEVTDQEIIDRMMIPLCTEAMRCLEDGIVTTSAEVDMGLILGLGFPRFRGGPLRYIDTLGLEQFAAIVKQHQDQGPLYRLTDGFMQRLKIGQTFFA
ncbi:fatty acid oxidation complex subunit alpha FadB [Amphritea sp. 1_MG-2023]|uniref:fatty acid oxidation complex subunit alpha FadB n=1 Tax=Amphritea sp. 1_MG-2023 TaxID=3062670 RepID=UPI0026E2D757|nr:fatty acid oxidation complex subunit alpha FadB [Amphritea sp. 1_MG-2023]MDO6562968.1 fatty acid oxidation complex subunit alpha FadB [Amphritea sp. 1_MG-2023]